MRERPVLTVTFLLVIMIFFSFSFLPAESIAQNNTTIPRQVVKYSLDEAINLALSQNPDVRKSRARIDGAKASLQKAESVFYPYLGASVGYTKADAPSVFLFKTIDQRALNFGPDFDFNDPGEVENYETALMGQINLFRGGSDYYNRKIAEKGVEASVSGKKTVENRLVASVILSYYDYLSAKEYVVISEESVKTVQSQLRIMNIRFRGGGALKSDILSLKVRLAQAREDLVRSRNRLKITIAAIARLLGLTPDTNVQFTSVGSVNIRVPFEYSEGLNDALKKRPELEHMKLQVKQSEMGVKAAKASWYPRVDLSGKYYYDDQEMSYGDDENWVVSVDVNMDLFTGFARGAAKKEAEAKLGEIKAADRDVLLGVKLDVKTAYLKKKEAEERYKVAQSSVDMAEESLKLVKKQYEGGSATITRYLEAELAKNRAKMRATAAFYDRAKSEADIARATGQLSEQFRHEVN